MREYGKTSIIVYIYINIYIYILYYILYIYYIYNMLIYPFILNEIDDNIFPISPIPRVFSKRAPRPALGPRRPGCHGGSSGCRCPPAAAAGWCPAGPPVPWRGWGAFYQIFQNSKQHGKITKLFVKDMYISRPSEFFFRANMFEQFRTCVLNIIGGEDYMKLIVSSWANLFRHWGKDWSTS